jgi:threonylcarbamoyladenosine tRNA methylthiotransferase MtaB
MARKVTPESYAMLVEMARKVIPGIAITTDVIAGFPGEGTIEFEESLNYIRSMKFAGGHAFTYSARPGTAAEKFPDQVPLPIKKIRNAQIREIFAKSAREYAIGFAGQIHEVLWESIDGYSPQGWQMNGLTKNDLRVMAFAARPSWNEVQPVKLIQYINGQFYGECGSTVQD